MNKVYICGLIASAKGVLRALLDSHPKIVNNPFDFGASFLRDDFIAFACRKNKEKYVREYFSHNDIKNLVLTVKLNEDTGSFSIGQLFTYLFTADRKYSDIFDISYSRKMPAPNLPGGFQVTDYNFLVFSFLDDFVERALSIKNFSSIEHLQDTLYEAMIINCNSMKQNYSDNFLFVQSSLNGYDIIEKILEKNSNPKILAVVRDPIALSFANYKREINKFHDFKNSNGFLSRVFSKYPFSLYSKGFIKKVKHYNKSILELSQIEKNVFVVRTEDMICNTRETMDGIADFLSIDRHEILYKPTISGDTMDGEMLSLVGHIHDDPYKSLSENQVKLLKYYFYGHQGNSLYDRVIINMIRFRMTLLNSRFTSLTYGLLKKLFLIS